DTQGAAVARDGRGPGRRRVRATQPGPPVAVLLRLRPAVDRRVLGEQHLPAPPRPGELHPHAPRVRALRARDVADTAGLDGLAAVAGGLHRGRVGGARKLGVRDPALQGGNGGVRLPRGHGGELGRRPPLLRARLRAGAAARLLAGPRGLRGGGGGAGGLDPGRTSPERRHADLPVRRHRGVAGGRTL
ncbi:MAG: hypothetical protein AVDCRST_MAG22-600, partial [uncultured Rubrobacteraceae bacterium]